MFRLLIALNKWTGEGRKNIPGHEHKTTGLEKKCLSFTEMRLSSNNNKHEFQCIQV